MKSKVIVITLILLGFSTHVVYAQSWQISNGWSISHDWALQGYPTPTPSPLKSTQPTPLTHNSTPSVTLSPTPVAEMGAFLALLIIATIVGIALMLILVRKKLVFSPLSILSGPLYSKNLISLMAHK